MLNRHLKFYSDDVKKDFKDVLIVPRRGVNNIKSRSNVSVKKRIAFNLPNKTVYWEGTPIISSNMDTVSNLDTFQVLQENNYITCFPKHMNEQWLNDKGGLPVDLVNVDSYMLSCGINKDDYILAMNLIDRLRRSNVHVKFLCIDVANGYLNQLEDVCMIFRETFPDLVIATGNVVTPDITYDLIKQCGVNIVKVGIGSGSVCETRLKAGVGYPQLSAVMECADAAHEAGGYIISDGGIEHPCDVVKAFAGGADFVMAGSLFAGHEESPGETYIDPSTNIPYKTYYGMASDTALKKYNNNPNKNSKGTKGDDTGNYRTSEGKKVMVRVKGSLKDTIRDINGGIRSACTYVNAQNIDELHEYTQFINVAHHHNTSLS
jgi:GMP reductase